MVRICGLDLGQARDPSAFVVLEGDGQEVKTQRQFQVRHMERFPLDRPYPEYVQRTVDLMRTPELRAASLVIDYTGVGRPVYDMFVAARLNPIGILITAGTNVSHRGRIWHVPKRDLVTAVLMLMQSRRLRVANTIPEAATLVAELLNFRIKVTLAGNDQYEAWREGDHDDLVLSAACAAWTAITIPEVHLTPAVGGQHRILVAASADGRQGFIKEGPNGLALPLPPWAARPGLRPAGRPTARS